MGLSKEYVLGLITQLQQYIDVSVPRNVEVLVPILELVYPGVAPSVPNPFSPESGKAYVFEALNGDQVVQIPDATGLTPGFCFDVMSALSAEEVPTSRLEIHPPSDGIIFGPACVTGLAPLASANAPFVMDSPSSSLESVRITFLGIFDSLVPILPATAFWKLDRLDSMNSRTKIVHRATTAALPAYTASGEYSNKVLTGDSGTLTVDGKEYTDLDDYKELILVKDEPENTAQDLGHNGIYRLIQVNPWKLRRASVWQNDYQIESTDGALIQVTEGSENAGKQFYINQWGKVPTEVPVGGGPLSQIDLDVAPGTYSDFGNGITGWNTADVVVIDVSSTGTVTIEGLYSSPVAGAGRERKIFRNDSPDYSIIIKHDDAGAAAQDRVQCKKKKDLTLLPNETAEFYYDTEEERWFQLDLQVVPRLIPSETVATDGSGVALWERLLYDPSGFTGTKRILLPGPPVKNGDKFAIKNVTSSTAVINMFSGYYPLEDPINGGIVGAGVDMPIGLAWVDIVWEMCTAGTPTWRVVGG